MPKTKKLAFMSLLTAAALGIFIVEAQLPPLIPVPGVKLGLANIITLAAMLLLGKKEAGAVLGVRILMGAMFAGPSTLLFSAAGGFLAYLSMCLLVRKNTERLWLVSMVSALCHNAGQLMVCLALVKTPGVLAYAPILAASGIVTGLFTGWAARYLVRALKKYIS